MLKEAETFLTFCGYVGWTMIISYLVYAALRIGWSERRRPAPHHFQR